MDSSSYYWWKRTWNWQEMQYDYTLEVEQGY
jgi:hypothetical protein